MNSIRKQFLRMCVMAVHSTAQLLFYLNITILKGHRHPGTYDVCVVGSCSTKNQGKSHFYGFRF